MLRTIVGIALLVAGLWLAFAGWSRKDSLMGSLAETGTSLANKFDGGARTPKHYLYLSGGAILAIGGAALVFTGRGKR